MFTLPGYLITEAIYKNDCLRVYRGERVQNRSPVMIKVPVAESHASIARLLHEFEIIRHLDIKGVIKPVGLELAGLIPVLVMEDHEFVPLKVYLGGSRPDLPVYFSIAVQLTEVLGELYEKNVIVGQNGSGGTGSNF